MKVEIVHRRYSDDYKQTIEINIDGKRVFDVWDGEPEDNTLYRNFNDCYKIGVLLKLAYEAGKLGEILEVIETNEEA